MKNDFKKENKVLKHTATTIRILLAILFFASGISYFFMGDLPIDLKTPAGQYLAGLMATGFFLPFLKIVEALCGLMLFFKRWTPLALLILAPIIIQIVLFEIFLDPATIVVGLVLIACSGFLAWYNWEKYNSLFHA